MGSMKQLGQKKRQKSKVDTNWHNYKVSVDSTRCTHTLDGVDTSITTDIPLSQQINIVMAALKSAGNATRSVYLDFAKLRVG